MDLPAKTVWDALSATGVEKLYHANSVVTSCQFIKQKALLARGAVERLKLSQTDQYSDDEDKRYSLWFDVFTDSVDIHSRASRLNKYGPVLFVLDLEKLRKVSTGRVWVYEAQPNKTQKTPVAPSIL